MWRMRRSLAIALPFMILLGSAVAAQASPAAPRIPRSGAYLGDYPKPDDWSKAGQKAEVRTLEADLGRKLDIDNFYHPWDNEFPTWRQRWDHRNGRIPMISWGGTHLNQILDGSHDPLLRDRADGLAALGGRVLLRWFYEMDAFIYDDDEIESPSQFIDAWRYVHDIFESRGANNVEWVWCPNASAFATGEAQQYYPGAAYVDWICADGYNWSPVRPNAEWTSFEDIFSAFYEWGVSKPRPLMVGETGVMENDPGDKAAWITAMGTTLREEYPEIKALVYFDGYATANFGGWYDWRLDTSDSSYDAFKDLARKRYFNPRR